MHCCSVSPVKSAEVHISTTRSAVVVSVLLAPFNPGRTTGKRAVAMNSPHDNPVRTAQLTAPLPISAR
jgi:hypothetical protein